MWILIVQRLTLEFFWHIFYFPLWWYTRGLEYISAYFFRMWRVGNSSLAPGLWLKNIFVPMFGQVDWQGRIMSFFMRLANVIIRSIGLFFWTVIISLLWCVWPILPIGMLYFLRQAW